MRLLIVGQSYAPESIAVAPYTAGLAEHFAGRGAEVVVVTTFPHYPQWRWHVDRPPFRATEHLGGVEVRRIWTYMAGKPSTAASRIAFDGVVSLMLLARSATVRRADVILCVSPPIQVALSAAVLGRAWGAATVVLAHDLPVQAAIGIGLIRPGLVAKVGLNFERLMYSAVDRVVVINNRFVDQLAEMGVDCSRVVVIPNWANVNRIRPMMPDSTVRAKLGASDSDFLIVHSGNMGEKQALDATLRAAELAGPDSDAKFALVGDGPQAQPLRAHIESASLRNVRVLPLQPENEVSAVLAAADVLLLSQARGVINSVLPSKLLSYMAACRPILAAAHRDSAAAELIRTADCGVVVSPDDPRALLEGIDYLRRSPSGREAMGKRGRAYVEVNFSKDRVLRQWESLISELTHNVSSPG